MIGADMEEIRRTIRQGIEEDKAAFAAEVAVLKDKYKSFGKTDKKHLKRYAKEIIDACLARKCGENTPAQWKEFCEAKKVLLALGCNDPRLV